MTVTDPVLGVVSRRVLGGAGRVSVFVTPPLLPLGLLEQGEGAWFLGGHLAGPHRVGLGPP